MDATEREARRRLADCTARLLTLRPFYGHLLQQFDLVYDPDFAAPMGVRFAAERGRIEMRFNPARWVQPAALPFVPGVTPMVPWTDSNLMAADEHEALHVVLKHLVRHPKGNRPVWNVAEDMVINQQLSGLPLGCVTLDFGGITYPPNLHADGYYRLLLQHLPPCPIHGKGKGEGGAGCSKAGEAGEGQTPGEEEGEGPEGEEGHCPHCTGETLDSHDGFEAAGNPEAEEAMRSAVGYAYRRYNEQREANRGKAGRGDLPADVVRMIEQMLHRPINWRHRLRCIGDSAIKRGHRTTIRRPHRRYGALYPGRRPARAGKVVVAVDTSGSISDKLLGAFWCEIRAIARKVGVVVVECDAALHDVWMLRQHGVPRLKGGGGSNFNGVFDLVLGRGELPPAWRRLVRGASKLIFLTDGDIAVPAANETGLEVFWAVPENRKAPTEAYGERIPMEVGQ